MSTQINHEAAPADIRDALMVAAQDFQEINAENAAAMERFENARWSGLDRLETVRTRLDEAADKLTAVAAKFGLADEVRNVLVANQMVGTKSSVVETGQ